MNGLRSGLLASANQIAEKEASNNNFWVSETFFRVSGYSAKWEAPSAVKLKAEMASYTILYCTDKNAASMIHPLTLHGTCITIV